MFALLLNNIRTIAIITAILAASGASWHVRGMKCEASRLKLENQAVSEALERTKAYNIIAAELEAVKAEKQKTKTIIRERIRNANDSSFGCHVSPDGVQLINDIIKGGGASEPNK